MNRFFQWCDLQDRAASERVSNYCRAIKSAEIGNRGACSYFQEKAQQWERIRILANKLILRAEGRN